MTVLGVLQVVHDDCTFLFQAVIHPDTGEKILLPFRMSGFVPFGSPIVVGLLLPNLTLPQTAFWQWLNQSHNACVNYANRNASKVRQKMKVVSRKLKLAVVF